MVDLGSLAHVMVGATPGASTTAARVMYVRAGDILAEGAIGSLSDGPAPAKGANTKLQLGDVVLRGRGAPAAATVSDRVTGAFPSNDVLVLRVATAVADPGYIAAFLNLPTTREMLSQGSQGAALTRLSVQALASLKVPLPPLETQRSVAALADSMRAEIALLDQQRALRIQMNQQILQRLLANAHDGGWHPHRGSNQTVCSSEQAVSPHLNARNL